MTDHVDAMITQDAADPPINHTWSNFKFTDFSDWVNIFKPGRSTMRIGIEIPCFSLKNDVFLLKNDDFLLKNGRLFCNFEVPERSRSGRTLVAICIQIDEFCISNDGFCNTNDEFCILNDELNARRNAWQAALQGGQNTAYPWV